jgi:hypothetical protein
MQYHIQLVKKAMQYHIQLVKKAMQYHIQVVGYCTALWE